MLPFVSLRILRSYKTPAIPCGGPYGEYYRIIPQNKPGRDDFHVVPLPFVAIDSPKRKHSNAHEKRFFGHLILRPTLSAKFLFYFRSAFGQSDKDHFTPAIPRPSRFIPGIFQAFSWCRVDIRNNPESVRRPFVRCRQNVVFLLQVLDFTLFLSFSPERICRPTTTSKP